MNEFVVEDGGVVGRAEIAVFHAPVANRLGDAGDELADASLALAGIHAAVQVFRGHDVGGGHRPVFGDLDVLLLEDDSALRVGDGGGAELPFDVVIRRDAGLGEQPAEGEPRRLLLIGGGRDGLRFDLGVFWDSFGHVFLNFSLHISLHFWHGSLS